MTRFYVSLTLDLSIDFVDWDACLGGDSDTFGRVTGAFVDYDYAGESDGTYLLRGFGQHEKAEECVGKVRTILAEHQRQGSLPTVEEIKRRVLPTDR